MKSVLFLIFVIFPAMAQERSYPDWRVEGYLNIFWDRKNEDIKKNPCIFVTSLQGLSLIHQEMDKDSENLKKLGVPGKVEKLRQDFTERIFAEFYERIKTGKVVDESCPYPGEGSDHRNIVLKTVFSIVGYLKGITTEYPRDPKVTRDLDDLWARSVKDEAPRLWSECQPYLRSHIEGTDPEKDLRKRTLYECRILAQAMFKEKIDLGLNIDPERLGLLQTLLQ